MLTEVERENALGGLAARQYNLLIVEDSEGDLFVITEALREHKIDCNLTTLTNGEAALQYLARLDGDASIAVPDLVLLDLNLPLRSGHQILHEIRSSIRCAAVPVIIVTSSEWKVDMTENRRLGATAYFRKHTRLDEYMKLGALVRSLLPI